MVAMRDNKISLSEKFLLSFEEAAKYFGIGEQKLRNMASLEENPKWVIQSGYRRLIKRVLLEEVLLKAETI